MQEDPQNMSFRQIRFKLEAAGFCEVKQLGNHAKFVRREAGKVRSAILPHYREISASVLASVLIQSGLSKDEFDQL